MFKPALHPLNGDSYSQLPTMLTTRLLGCFSSEILVLLLLLMLVDFFTGCVVHVALELQRIGNTYLYLAYMSLFTTTFRKLLRARLEHRIFGGN
jgi:hypothetical protein